MAEATHNHIGLHYVVRKPEIPSEHPPVIILLHGIGSNEADLFSLTGVLPQKYLVVSARAPIILGEKSFAWYEVDFSTGKPVYDIKQEEESRSKLIQFISGIKEKYSVNDKEVYLCGFSQGGIMSYSIALTRPDLIRGIAVMSGRLLDEVKPLITKPETFKDLRVFVSHGVSDRVISIEHARQSMVFLKSFGLNPTYKEYATGHTLDQEMLKDLVQWLKA